MRESPAGPKRGAESSRPPGASGRGGGSEGEGGSGPPELHPLVRAAGVQGRLPGWARCGPERRAHTGRVRELVIEWAEELEIAERDRTRWAAAATLHDALRDATTEELRPWTDLERPAGLLHGPACAGRLRAEGVEDREVLDAIAHHTTGHPGLAEPGEILYLADFLEPGREFLEEPRLRIRLIMPVQKEEALRSVVALRIAHRLEVRGPIHPDTVRFWNRVIGP